MNFCLLDFSTRSLWYLCDDRVYFFSVSLKMRAGRLRRSFTSSIIVGDVSWRQTRGSSFLHVSYIMGRRRRLAVKNMDNGEKNKSKKRSEKQGLLKNYSVIIASIFIILAGIHCARSILGPFFLAVFFTVLLILPVNWLKSKGMVAWKALTIVVIGVVFVGLGAMVVVGAQMTQFAKDIPEYRDRFSATLENYNLDIGDIVPFLKSEKGKENAPTEELNGEQNEDEIKTSYRKACSQESTYERVNDERVDDESKTESDDSRAREQATIQSSTKDSRIVAVSFANVDANVESQNKTSRDYDENVSDELNSDNLNGLILSDPPQFPPKSDELAQDVETLDDRSTNEKQANFDEFDVPGTETDDVDEIDETSRAKQNAMSAVDVSSKELFRFLRGLASELSYLGSNTFLIMLLVIFMLIETELLPKKLVAVLGRRRFTNSHIEGVLADIRNYMVIKTFVSVIVGVSVTILCFASRVQYPLLWGFVAFLLNYIPNIGSVVAAIPPIVLATVEHGIFIGCVDAVFFVLINCTVGYALEPRLLGDGLDLSPLIVLIALIFFGWLLGPVGMFLSPPLAVIMKIIFQAFPETRWIAGLMANKPPVEIVEDDPDDSEDSTVIA